MKTRGWKELVRFVLSWQPDVQVLRPSRKGTPFAAFLTGHLAIHSAL